MVIKTEPMETESMTSLSSTREQRPRGRKLAWDKSMWGRGEESSNEPEVGMNLACWWDQPRARGLEWSNREGSGRS